MEKITEEESQQSIDLYKESSSTQYFRYCKEIQEEWDEIVSDDSGGFKDEK